MYFGIKLSFSLSNRKRTIKSEISFRQRTPWNIREFNHQDVIDWVLESLGEMREKMKTYTRIVACYLDVNVVHLEGP